MLNPMQLMLCRYRRNERDVRALYENFKDFMVLATSGDMLNFGYWNNGCDDPKEAQVELCRLMADFLDLKQNQYLLDVGGGEMGPARLWQAWLNPIRIVSIDIRPCHSHSPNGISVLQASALNLPFKENLFDRIVALESAQHFRPLDKFLVNARKCIRKDGKFGLAIPGIMKDKINWNDRRNLGILNITWASEHHNLLSIPAMLESSGFHDVETRFIGDKVYAPLADYYMSHRDYIKTSTNSHYSPSVEYFVFKSMLHMKKAAQKRIIDYALIRASA